MRETSRIAGIGSALLAGVEPRVRAFGAGTWWIPGESGQASPGASLEVRLAVGAKEIRRAQRLRYKVFFEEGAALPSPVTRLARRDADAFDPICDHLLVLDHAVKAKPFRKPKPKVVGTYRLLRREIADREFGFYSAREFDLAPLLAGRPDANVVELGRSCVLKPYRSSRTIELLWQGVWAYALRHGTEVMIGCASLEGTDTARLALPLGYLHHYACAPPEWRVRALAERRVAMDLLPRDEIDRRAAFKALPTLVKGYLRLGATVGDGAVVDSAFGTTDVFVVLPVEAIHARYVDRFGPPANAVAA